ncbi:6-hydroxymethylpterin diphosphokinase MptE-like protein [Mesorhizobium sp. KR1-2]|uniref:6-hydroxymethylpterin diphosphokinase MptE-like protein n=1 Tax=Mesorhizobium sp. KR1-2 TaxID=3156609 RepID=UPI0032B38D2A
MAKPGVAREVLSARLGRVAAETGGAGGLVRLVSRLLLAASEIMDRAGCALFCSVPPRLLTRLGDRRRLERNRQLNGRHEARRCFILGNGPSLRDEDISPLCGEICFTVNQGHRFAISKGLKPRYHAIVDAHYLRSQFDGLHAEWLAFQKSTGATLLLSTEIAERMAMLGLQVEHYAVKQYSISTYFDRSGRFVPVDLHHVQPGYVSVVHFAIVAALYMGFSEIYLLGCDMDYFLRPAAPLRHSYDDESMELASAADLFGRDQVELMEWALVEYRAFSQLGRLAQARGSRIINAGTRSALDVFPKKPLCSVVGQLNGAQA